MLQPVIGRYFYFQIYVQIYILIGTGFKLILKLRLYISKILDYFGYEKYNIIVNHFRIVLEILIN